MPLRAIGQSALPERPKIPNPGEKSGLVPGRQHSQALHRRSVTLRKLGNGDKKLKRKAHSVGIDNGHNDRGHLLLSEPEAASVPAEQPRGCQ